MFSPAQSLDDYKQQARILRQSLARNGQEISHSHALEIVAQQNGFRDWNTLHASRGNRPQSDYKIGDQVAGRYLGRPFTGHIHAVSTIGGDHFRLTLRFDEPVDVIAFEGWSAFRKQINATVDRFGVTAEKTSDGEPHLVLAP